MFDDYLFDFPDMELSGHLEKELTVNRELIREIKIKMLSIENRLPLIEGRFNFSDYKKPYQYRVDALKHLGVMCGSFSLYVYGLLDRQPKDIDMLVDRNSDIIKEFLKENVHNVNQYREDTSFMNKVDGFNNVEQFKMDDIVIDLFHDTNCKFDEFDDIKIQCPFQVIQKKIDIYEEVRRSKDYRDLKLINKRLGVILEKQEDIQEHEYLI